VLLSTLPYGATSPRPHTHPLPSKVTIQAEGDEGNAFSVLHISGNVHYSIYVDVKSRIEIHNDIVRQVLLPSFPDQLAPAQMADGEGDDEEKGD
jgi:hypothetical protein